jgi:hypothetical protein
MDLNGEGWILVHITFGCLVSATRVHVNSATRAGYLSRRLAQKGFDNSLMVQFGLAR